LWAMWIYYEREGRVDADKMPAHAHPGDTVAVSLNQLPEQTQEELNEIAEDSLAVHSPVWDTQTAGQESRIDSADIMRMARRAIAEAREQELANGGEHESRLSENLGLAHVHVNGQALLLFAIGLIFLFSSATPGTKKIVYWIGGIAIVLHAIGLTGKGYAGVFKDLVAISGVVLLALFAYMALRIYMDLGHKPSNR
ncbi:hypothetical protein C3F09_00510, partial [candidate division GN15 bacterium]